MFRSTLLFPINRLSLAIGLAACSHIFGDTTTDSIPKIDVLKKSAIFHASFDSSPNANVSRGDQQIYTAESLERKQVQRGLQTEAVRWDPKGGKPTPGKKQRGALHFTTATKQLVFFKGGKNVPYNKQDFNGTVSLWMKLSPKEDLPKGYVDPLQITDKKWNDASFFVDFDQSAERPFRLGVFSDFKFWNPTNRKFDNIPQAERPMVPVTKWPFDRERWTHVAFTWNKINSDDEARCTLYVDGKPQGHIGGKQRFTWSSEKCVIMLGINYVGWIDDLAIFDRSLTDDEIKALASE